MPSQGESGDQPQEFDGDGLARDLALLAAEEEIAKVCTLPGIAARLSISSNEERDRVAAELDAFRRRRQDPRGAVRTLKMEISTRRDTVGDFERMSPDATGAMRFAPPALHTGAGRTISWIQSSGGEIRRYSARSDDEPQLFDAESFALSPQEYLRRSLSRVLGLTPK